MNRRFIAGLPTGASAWRHHVGTNSAGLPGGSAVRLDFVLPPGRWVDIDTLAENTLKGLRDAGVLQSRYAGLDAILVTKREDAPAGVDVQSVAAATVVECARPGPPRLDVAAPLLPRAARPDVKRAWRGVLAHAWADRPPLDGGLWADVSMPVAGSLIAPLEVVLDALEPVLGRDPRGRAWQEFFPNDHLITWLRVHRTTLEEGLRLRMGPILAV